MTGLAATGLALAAMTGCATSDAAGTSDASSPDGPDAGKRRAPDAIGAVVSVTVQDDVAQVVFAPDPGYEYYEGTIFTFGSDVTAAIDGEQAVVIAELEAGDRLNVWTGLCRESFPVQCDVEAVTPAS